MSGPIPRGPFDQGLFLAHYNKGRELFEARRFEEAERQLEEAYLLRPRDPRVLNLLGLVYFRGEKLEKAEEVYRKLIAESPEAHTLHYNLGIICFKLGRLEDAESLFLKALELTHGNPKIHFYLGSIYEKLHRYKDAIYQYRQAGASRMVQRLQGRLGQDGDATTPPGAARPLGAAPPAAPAPSRRPPPDTRPGLRPDAKATQPLTRAEEAARGEEDAPTAGRSLQPVSPSLMAEGAPPALASTARFLVDDTLPPGTRRLPVPPLEEPPGTRPRMPVPSLEEPPRPAGRDVFRGLERGLMEVEFSGRVFIKQGTIYSYTGNLTFVVKEKRPGAHPWLVMVIGSGRLILTDKDREITFMQVADEPVFVEPSHLLACEESLKPSYARLGGDEHGLEVVALEGRGMLALSVSSKPLPLSVRPGQPVCVPASSVIMWTGELVPHEVDDPEVFAVVLPSSATSGRLFRLEGTGRILVEQAAGQ
jgi:Flp pilus assembly protein TadD/uncharacterized protein (AIM24 family)